jgi:hypothetical protein
MSVAVLDRSLIGSSEKSVSQPVPLDAEGSWVVHARIRYLEGFKWE